jgi:hypothetical protein
MVESNKYLLLVFDYEDGLIMNLVAPIYVSDKPIVNDSWRRSNTRTYTTGNSVSLIVCGKMGQTRSTLVSGESQD